MKMKGGEVVAITLLAVICSLTEAGNNDLSRINYGVVLSHRGSCVISPSSWTAVFSIDLIVPRVQEPQYDLVCTSDRWRHLDRDLCKFMRPLIMAYETELRLMRSHADSVLVETNEIFLDSRVETRKRSLFDLGGKLLKWGIGTLDAEDLRTIQKMMRHAENRVTEMQVGVRHDVADLKSYQTVVNARVDNFIEYLNQTNIKLKDTVRQHLTTAEEITHIKNLLVNQTGREIAFLSIFSKLNEVKRGIELLHAGRLSRAVISPRQLQYTLDSIQQQIMVNNSHLRLAFPHNEFYFRNGKYRTARIENVIHIFLEIPLKVEDFDDIHQFYSFHKVPLPAGELSAGHVMNLAHVTKFVAFGKRTLDSFYMEFEVEPRCENGGVYKLKSWDGPFRSFKDGSCISALILDNAKQVAERCQYTVSLGKLESNIYRINSSHVLAINMSGMRMECIRGDEQISQIPDCAMCVIKVGPTCVLKTDTLIVPMHREPECITNNLRIVTFGLNIPYLLNFIDSERVNLISGAALLANEPETKLPTPILSNTTKNAFIIRDRELGLKLQEISHRVKNNQSLDISTLEDFLADHQSNQGVDVDTSFIEELTDYKNYIQYGSLLFAVFSVCSIIYL